MSVSHEIIRKHKIKLIGICLRVYFFLKNRKPWLHAVGRAFLYYHAFYLADHIIKVSGGKVVIAEVGVKNHIFIPYRGE